MTTIEEYYNKFNEEKRLNTRHGRVEFITSMKYIHKYIDILKDELKAAGKEAVVNSDIRILDIGAGTGRYSVPLVEEGFDVSPGGSDSKESACSVGDPGSIPGLGRSPGEGLGNPLQYSCLEKSMDRGAWWAAVHEVPKSQTRLND